MRSVLLSLILVAAVQAVDRKNVMGRVQPPLNQSRIVGGSQASVGQFKYQVGVVMDDVAFCGGSLISDRVVLTSAQCVRGFTSFTVHCGALNIGDLGEVGHVTMVTSDVTVHPQFSTFFLLNDIAVIRLGEAASGDNIEAVRLPGISEAGLLFEGEVARASGWGKTADDGSDVTEMLKFVDVVVIANVECEEFFGNIVVQGTTLCTSSNEGTEAACDNDHGGPLVITGADDLPTLVGVMSFRSGAGCESLAPTGFTRVTSYLTWIATETGIPVRP